MRKDTKRRDLPYFCILVQFMVILMPFEGHQEQGPRQIVEQFCKAEFEGTLERYEYCQRSAKFKMQWALLGNDILGGVFNWDSDPAYIVESYHVVDIQAEKEWAKARVVYKRLARCRGQSKIVEDYNENDVAVINLNKLGNKWWIVDPPFVSISKKSLMQFYQDQLRRFGEGGGWKKEREALRILQQLSHRKREIVDAPTELRSFVEYFCKLEFHGDTDDKRIDVVKFTHETGGRKQWIVNWQIIPLDVVSSYKVLDVGLEGKRAWARIQYEPVAKAIDDNDSLYQLVQDTCNTSVVTLSLINDNGRWYVLDPPLPKISTAALINIYEEYLKPFGPDPLKISNDAEPLDKRMRRIYIVTRGNLDLLKSVGK